jgi:hypothetical protein
MPTCQKCAAYFPLKQVVDGKPRIFTSRRYCLTCSPFGKHNTKNLTPTGNQQLRICKLCDKQYIAGRGHYLQVCKSCRTAKYRQELKRQAVRHLGGRCQICGYSRCLSALQFHHRDPKQKVFTIADYSGGWEKIRLEVEKCVLLCGNCHTEVHAGLTIFAPDGQSEPEGAALP